MCKSCENATEFDNVVIIRETQEVLLLASKEIVWKKMLRKPSIWPWLVCRMQDEITTER
jgi:hypothetical protein